MTRIAAAYEEYDFYRQQAHIARGQGRHSDAQHYERMAQDALEQLRRESKEKAPVDAGAVGNLGSQPTISF